MPNQRDRDGQFRDAGRQQRTEERQAAAVAAGSAMAEARERQAAQGRAEVEAVAARVHAAGGAGALSRRERDAAWDAMMRGLRKQGR